jgi:hypothetical protein
MLRSAIVDRGTVARPQSGQLTQDWKSLGGDWPVRDAERDKGHARLGSQLVNPTIGTLINFPHFE